MHHNAIHQEFKTVKHIDGEFCFFPATTPTIVALESLRGVVSVQSIVINQTEETSQHTIAVNQ